MSGLFDIFSAESSKDTTGTAPDTIFNSEMDDIDLPEGAEFPTPEALLEVTEKIDKRLEESGNEGQSSVESDPNSSSQSPEDPGTDGAHDATEDVLSIATDVNRHDADIEHLTSRVRSLESQLEAIPALDIRLRKIEESASESISRLNSISSVLTDLRASFNTYQSNTANKIADVERRAAQKQLRTNPPVPSSAVVPPSEVSISRTGVPDPEQTPTAVKPRVADLSDW